jgi:hypothetical protein
MTPDVWKVRDGHGLAAVGQDTHQVQVNAMFAHADREERGEGECNKIMRASPDVVRLFQVRKMEP